MAASRELAYDTQNVPAAVAVVSSTPGGPASEGTCTHDFPSLSRQCSLFVARVRKIIRARNRAPRHSGVGNRHVEEPPYSGLLSPRGGEGINILR